MQDSLKLSSFIEITVHPQICCFWCRWVDLADLYSGSLLNLTRIVRQMPSNSKRKQSRTVSVLHVIFGLNNVFEHLVTGWRFLKYLWNVGRYGVDMFQIQGDFTPISTYLVSRVSKRTNNSNLEMLCLEVSEEEGIIYFFSWRSSAVHMA